MNKKLPYLLILAIVLGQAIKFPSTTQGGLTALDLVVLGLDLFALYRLRQKLFSLPMWAKGVLPFLFFAIISLILTPLKLNFGEYFYSFSYAARFILYLSLGLVIGKGVFPEIKKEAAKILVYSGSLLSILAFVQLIVLPDLALLQANGWDPHYLRAVSTFLDPNFLGGFLSLTFLTNLLQPKLFSKKVSLFISGLIFLVILLTFSRSVALMIGAGVLAAAILRKSLKLFFLTAFLTLAMITGLNFYHYFIELPRQINRTQSAQYRVDAWQEGIKMFSHQPLLGVGFNAYRYALQQYQLAPTSFTSSRGASANDSSLLTVAATTGILGLISYLGFLLTLAYLGFTNYLKKNIWGVILLSGLAGALLQSLFINFLFYPWFLIWLALVLSQIDKTYSSSTSQR